MSIEIRPMQPDERDRVLDLLEAAFREREVFRRYIEFDPAYRPDDFVLALDGDRPVSCVQVFAKPVRLRGREIRLGGIGSVATHPDYRNRGLALELLRLSELRMRERGMPLGLLFSTIRELYGPLGWVPIRTRQLALHPLETPRDPPPDVSRRTYAADDLAAIRDLYDGYSQALEGTTLRDLAYWNGQLSYAGSATGETFHVAERKGEIVAYARHADLGAPILMEYAHAPGAEEALAWLIAEFCEVDRALLLRLPPGLPLEHALLRHVARADPVDDPTFMWRVLDRERLAQLSGLAPDASEREILRELIETPPVHYWVSDRF